MSREPDEDPVTPAASLPGPREPSDREPAQSERPRKLVLEVVEGVAVGRSSELERGTLRIGSDDCCELALIDADVSPIHCEIIAGPSGVRVRDLASEAGTFLDGVRVLDAFLRDGSRLELGGAVLRASFGALPPRELVFEGSAFGELVGSSEPMRRMFAVLMRAACTESTVLIEGETGTGKEGAAHAVHLGSTRKDGPFVVVDCGAIPENLIESELFGHEKGAFTGAVNRHLGAFEQAEGGTVLLDEVGELPLDLQPKLLRVLEQRTVRRVGSGERRNVDVRIVAATNRDLKQEVLASRFRADLYFRLSVLKVVLPPLRARLSDLESLSRALLERLAASSAQLERFTSPAFVHKLQQHAWPGNVRELRNYLERCAVMDDELPLADEGPGVQLRADGGPAGEVDGIVVEASLPYDDARQRAIGDFERVYLKALLERCAGNVSQAAREAGIDRVYLHRLIRKHSLKG